MLRPLRRRRVRLPPGARLDSCPPCTLRAAGLSSGWSSNFLSQPRRAPQCQIFAPAAACSGPFEQLVAGSRISPFSRVSVTQPITVFSLHVKAQFQASSPALPRGYPIRFAIETSKNTIKSTAKGCHSAITETPSYFAGNIARHTASCSPTTSAPPRKRSPNPNQTRARAWSRARLFAGSVAGCREQAVPSRLNYVGGSDGCTSSRPRIRASSS